MAKKYEVKYSRADFVKFSLTKVEHCLFFPLASDQKPKLFLVTRLQTSDCDMEGKLLLCASPGRGSEGEGG